MSGLLRLLQCVLAIGAIGAVGLTIFPNIIDLNRAQNSDTKAPGNIGWLIKEKVQDRRVIVVADISGSMAVCDPNRLQASALTRLLELCRGIAAQDKTSVKLAIILYGAGAQLVQWEPNESWVDLESGSPPVIPQNVSDFIHARFHSQPNGIDPRNGMGSDHLRALTRLNELLDMSKLDKPPLIVFLGDGVDQQVLPPQQQKEETAIQAANGAIWDPVLTVRDQNFTVNHGVRYAIRNVEPVSPDLVVTQDRSSLLQEQQTHLAERQFGMPPARPAEILFGIDWRGDAYEHLCENGHATAAQAHTAISKVCVWMGLTRMPAAPDNEADLSRYFDSRPVLRVCENNPRALNWHSPENTTDGVGSAVWHRMHSEWHIGVSANCSAPGAEIRVQLVGREGQVLNVPSLPVQLTGKLRRVGGTDQPLEFIRSDINAPFTYVTRLSNAIEPNAGQYMVSVTVPCVLGDNRSISRTFDVQADISARLMRGEDAVGTIRKSASRGMRSEGPR